MSGLEQAIRNALERADRSDADIRSRIYQSARNALDAGLRKQDIDDPETIRRQRDRLEQTIDAIEAEERERLSSMPRPEETPMDRNPPTARTVEPERIPEIRPRAELSVTHQQGPKVEPRSQDLFPQSSRSVEHARPQNEQPAAQIGTAASTIFDAENRITPPAVFPGERVESESDAVAEDEGSLAGLSMTRQDYAGRHSLREEEQAAWAAPDTPEGRTVPERRRSAKRRAGSFFVSLFVYCVLIGVIGFGAWWIYATGLYDVAMRGKGNFELVPTELQTEDFDPKPKTPLLDPQRGFSSEWTSVFDPQDKAGVRARGDATIEEVSDSDGKALSIKSSAPDQSGEVQIDVPAAVLQELAGKTSVIALTLRADSDTSTQIYVQCEFGSLGNCGRHRFTVSNERSDQLIKVNFDGKLGPSQPGHIVVNSDITGAGRGIRIYGIRILPGA